MKCHYFQENDIMHIISSHLYYYDKWPFYYTSIYYEMVPKLVTHPVDHCGASQSLEAATAALGAPTLK